MIALKERQLQYTETVVSLISGEVNTPWYLKMTTKGLVPALKIGDRVITESEAIIEAIDELPDGKGDRSFYSFSVLSYRSYYFSYDILQDAYVLYLLVVRG